MPKLLVKKICEEEVFIRGRERHREPCHLDKWEFSKWIETVDCRCIKREVLEDGVIGDYSTR